MAVSDGTARTLIAGGQLAPVAVLSRQRSTLLPEVPTIFEVATIGDEQAWWLDYRAGLTELGRTLIAAPGTPDDRLAVLRQAVDSVLNDPVVVAEIGRAHVCTPVTNAHLVCRLLLEKHNI